jgi:hypothetical protein
MKIELSSASATSSNGIGHVSLKCFGTSAISASHLWRLLFVDKSSHDNPF